MDKIKELLIEYERNIGLKCSGITRRGQCGEINMEIIFKNLISDLSLKKIDIPKSDFPTGMIDIYEYDNMYIKRLCICDSDCSIESNCSKYKIKLNCDGHHLIIISNSVTKNLIILDNLL